MKKRSIATILALLLLLSPALTTMSLSAPPPPAKRLISGKISPALAASINANNADLMVQVIILTNGPVSFLLKLLIGTLGGTILREFKILYGLAVILPLGVLGTLALDLGVASITTDRPMKPLMDVTQAAVGADVAQNNYGLDGRGIGVAVIDSGINSDDEDLKSGPYTASRVVYSENFVRGESTTRDTYGHGTHVAGIIAGDGTSSTCSTCYRKIEGIAPRAKLINLRVLNAKGGGYESDVIAGVEKAMTLQNTYNIKVINLSIGAGVYDSYLKDPLCKVANLAWNRGMLVVASAGNFGNTEYGPYGLITSPGNSPYVLTVGATNTYGTANVSDDTITTYSSRGPTLYDHIAKPDLVAPGNKIKSLLAKGSALALNPQFSGNLVQPSYYTTSTSGKTVEYFTLSGTSMAAPVVSGAAALMYQKDTSLTNNTVKLRMMASAKKVFSQRYDLMTVGAGLLDIPAALNKTGTSAISKSPYIKRDPNTPSLSLVVDGGWTNNAPFSTAYVWGSNINGTAYVWGSGYCWGSGYVWGSDSPFDDPGSSLTDPQSQQTIAAQGD
jgi:serine protease AprX